MTMKPYQPIHCDRHDFLEIACMHRCELSIELNDGTQTHAQAMTTRTATDKGEYFCVKTPAGLREIRLDQLRAITPVGHSAGLFGRISFRP